MNPIIVPVIVTAIGLILYLLTKDKPAELGRWMFIIGLAFVCYFGVRL